MPSREGNGPVPKMTGGQAIVGTLTQHGVDTVFGLPGVQLDNTFDALYEARNEVRLIHTWHEQGAAFATAGPVLIEMPIGAVPNTWALVKRPPSAATN